LLGKNNDELYIININIGRGVYIGSNSGEEEVEIKNWIKNRIVYVTDAGSHAYGMATEESDHDYRGACIPPKDYYYGFPRFEQSDSSETVGFIKDKLLIADRPTENTEAVIWSLNKMIELAAQGNPNMIELLFMDDTAIIYADPLMQRFFEIKESFISKVLKHRFSGYALAQLKRIRNHKRWIDNPPDQPTREEYGIEGISMPKDQIFACDKLIELQVGEWLVDQTVLPADVKIQLGPSMVRMINVVLEQIQLEHTVEGMKDVLERAASRHLGFDADFINFLNRYKAYKNHKQDYASYQSWLRNRNPKRAELERKHGLDTKHASHLVRLLRMAKEILNGKGVIVRRPDAQELLDIRNKGIWSYEYLVEWAEREDKELDEIMNKSSLPQQPDRNKISKVLVEVIEEYQGTAI